MKQLSIFSLIFCLFFNLHPAFAQPPAIEWQHCFGSNMGEYAWSIRPTNDGGFIVGGYTENNGGDVVGYHGNPQIDDVWILKLNSKGNIEWKKVLGGTFFETGADIHQTPDGGYILAATQASVNCDIQGNHGGADYWVVKLTSKGDVSWQKSFGGSKNEYAYSLDFTADGGYIISGESESNDGDVTGNHGYRDSWIIKINAGGSLVWQKSLGGFGDDVSYSVRVTSDGGCIAAGYTDSNDGDVTGNHGNRDYWVVKLDNTGNLQWQKCLGGSSADEAWSIQITNDGGYIVTGYSSSNNGNVSGNHQSLGAFSDFWLVKLTSTGNIQWQKCYGGTYNEIAYYVQLTPDGGYIVTGSAESADVDLSCNGGITDCWIIKVDGAGTLQWQKSFGGNLYDEAHAVQSLSDGGYIVAGSTCSLETSGLHPNGTSNGTCDDFWIIKLGPGTLPVPNPSVIIDPGSTKLCSGQATLTTSVMYAGTKYTFRWLRNGIDVGINTSTYSAIDFKDNDVIVCVVDCGGKCEDVGIMEVKDTVVLHSNNLVIQPLINLTADNTLICNCTPVTFKTSVTNGGPSPFFEWWVNNMNTGYTGSTYITKTLNDGDVIKCTYSDTTACIVNSPAVSNSIQVHAGANVQPTVAISSSKNDICAGTPVIFSASTENAGANPTFQWKINGANTGTNSNVFTTSSLNNGDIVTCSILADPAFNCIAINSATSNNVIMHVLPEVAPSVNINASAGAICVGTSVTFNATSSNAGPDPVYSWKVNGVDAGTNSNSFVTSSLQNGDAVSCAIKTDPVFTCASSPSATSNIITMTVNPGINPSITINASDDHVCFGKPIDFNATVENAGSSPVFQWKLNSENVGQNTPVYRNSILEDGDSISCFLLTGNDACSNPGTLSNTLHVNIYALPKISISPSDTIILAGTGIRLHADVTGNISSFLWQPASKLENPLLISPTTIPLSSNTTYTLSVQSDKGCDAEKSAIVKIFQPLNMPNAFTPNGDGVNDIFRIPPGVSLKLKEFSIYDRFGNRVFTTADITRGWDGKMNGQKSPADIYVYTISGTNEKGAVALKGIVLLSR